MNEDKKIAVDIVLLLPQEIIDKCVFVNSKLDNSDYVSFNDGYNPHITLGMGCVDVDKLENFKNEIATISKNTQQLQLTIVEFSGDNFFGFKIGKNQRALDLHSSIMKVLKDMSACIEAKPEMFYESEKVRYDGGLINWVSNFITEHSNDKYDPHISIGKGERPHIDFPIQFFAKKIGIFHLGSHGTCKEKLAEFDLK